MRILPLPTSRREGGDGEGPSDGTDALGGREQSRSRRNFSCSAMGQAVSHHRNECDEGRRQESHDGDCCYGNTTARLGVCRPGAGSKRREEPGLLALSGRRRQMHEEEGQNNRKEGHRIRDEGDGVAERGDRDPRQRRTDDTPEIELRRVE